MDSLKIKYRTIVEQLLADYADFLGSDEVQMELVFDRDHDRYLLVETGWQDGYRIYGSLLHIPLSRNTLRDRGLRDKLKPQ